MLEAIPGGLGQFLDKGLFLGSVALAVIAYILGWWVSGREYRAAVKDRDYWRDAALKNAHTAMNVTKERSSAVYAMEQIVAQSEQGGGGDP